MTRFLVDESLPRAVAQALVDAGHDVVDVRDIGLRGATDSVIASHAASDSRVIIAGDTDFANALRFPPGSHPGIVVLRVPNTFTPAERASRFTTVLNPILLARLEGAIVIIEPARVRILAPRGGP